MSIEQKLRNHIITLINEGTELAKGTQHHQVFSTTHLSECTGWITAASHIVDMVNPGLFNAYKQSSDFFVIESKTASWSINQTVGKFSELLRRLLNDIDNGLIATVATQARAEALDDLLDMAVEYFKLKRLDGSSILATAVFEDTLRRIARSGPIDDKGAKIDHLISTMQKENIITSIIAKRCRAAAGVRNSALHAQFDEITLNDVDAVIILTRELLNKYSSQ